MEEKTIFDKIVAKELPAKIVFEDEDVLAFHDINPQAPVHVVVIPKRKAPNYDALLEQKDDDVGRLFKGVAKVAKKLGLREGYRVVVNCGKHGQQTVHYIHAHLLGGRQLAWPPG